MLAELLLACLRVASSRISCYGKRTNILHAELIRPRQNSDNISCRLSYFYTSKELPIRLSFFWTALDGTQIITSILAFGLLHMRGVHGMAGWRW